MSRKPYQLLRLKWPKQQCERRCRATQSAAEASLLHGKVSSVRPMGQARAFLRVLSSEISVTSQNQAEIFHTNMPSPRRRGTVMLL